jgi:hypothetical protein
MDATINTTSVSHLNDNHLNHKRYIQNYIKNLPKKELREEVLNKWLLGNFMHNKLSSGANQEMKKLLNLINNAPRSTCEMTLYRATTSLLFEDAGVNSQNPSFEYTEPKSWTVNINAANTFADYINEQPINKIVLQLQIPEDFMGFLFIGCPPDPRLCSIRKMINLYRQLNIPVYRIKGWIIPEYEILLKPVKLYITNYDNPRYTTIYSNEGIPTTVKLYNVTLFEGKMTHSYYPKQVAHTKYSQNYSHKPLVTHVQFKNDGAGDLKINTLMSNLSTGIGKFSTGIGNFSKKLGFIKQSGFGKKYKRTKKNKKKKKGIKRR